MPREITSNNYTATCAELICLFAAAIEAHRRDRDDQDTVGLAALELATACGWDWETDASYIHFALNATSEEGFVEGLQRALAVVRVRFDTFLSHPKEAS